MNQQSLRSFFLRAFNWNQQEYDGGGRSHWFSVRNCILFDIFGSRFFFFERFFSMKIDKRKKGELRITHVVVTDMITHHPNRPHWFSLNFFSNLFSFTLTPNFKSSFLPPSYLDPHRPILLLTSNWLLNAFTIFLTFHLKTILFTLVPHSNHITFYHLLTTWYVISLIPTTSLHHYPNALPDFTSKTSTPPWLMHSQKKLHGITTQNI
jgi:hypothetical protein